MVAVQPQSKAKNIQAIYPLSFLQQGMLFHSNLAPESGIYCVQISIELIGDLNKKVFKQALATIVERHDVFRTLFIALDQKKPRQVVRQKVRLPFQEYDWTDLNESKQQKDLATFLKADLKQGFNFQQAPVMRCALIAMSAQQHHFIWNLHHSIIDGWSISIVLTEFMSIYETIANQQPQDLPTVNQYQEFINWLQQRDIKEAEIYWRQYFVGIDAPTPIMMTHHQLAHDQVVKPTTVWRYFSADFTTELRNLARQQQLTMNVICQAAWAILLGLYNNTQDVIFGTTVSGRPAELPGIEKIVGPFINSVPVRMQIDGDITVITWLKQLYQAQITQDEYSYTPLIDILRYTDIAHNVMLFDSLLVFKNMSIDAALRQSHWSLEYRNIEFQEQTAFPCSLIFHDSEVLALEMHYRPDCFTAKHIDRLVQQYMDLLQNLVANPNKKLNELAFINNAERQHLLQLGTQAYSGNSNTIIQHLFEQQVQIAPEAIALSSTDVTSNKRPKTYSYHELNRQANQLAHYLRAQGVVEGERVAICVNDSFELITAIVAIIKAGGAYVPIDPDYPQERINYILADSGARILLGDAKILSQVNTESMVVKLVLGSERFMQQLKAQPMDNLPSINQADSLAYVMYTSGSTGKPKGVMVPHKGIFRLIIETNYINITAQDIIAQASNVAFDVATFEIWGALLNGARLQFIDKNQLIQPLVLAATLQQHQVTILVVTTAIFNQMAQLNPAGFSCLNYLLFGGEMVDVSAVREVLKAGKPKQLLHTYGPTENTTFTTCYPVNEHYTELESVPIGYALSGTQLYVLDAKQRLVPQGILGELYVGGLGLARGYLNQLALNEEKFIAHPFDETPGARLYRTGDLVRWYDDGRLLFVDRIDNQVKIRGFRIEPGEVEHYLTLQPQVKEGAVLVVIEADSEKQLVAYLTLQPEVLLNSSASTALKEIKLGLKKSLPTYMIPAQWVVLDSLPLNANDKIDRKSLLKLGDRSYRNDEFYIAPSNEIERQLCELWQEVLKLDKVGVKDNFFESGGHSLLANRIISSIREIFTVELPLQVLFEQPTVQALSTAIVEYHQQYTLPSIKRVAHEKMMPLSYSQQRLWFIDQFESRSSHYNMPFAVTVTGELTIALAMQAVNQIVSRHDVLRTYYTSSDHGVFQQVLPTAEASYVITDLTNLAESEQPQQVLALAEAEAYKPFDLATGEVLLRMHFIKLQTTPEPSHVLLFTMHHIASDGWSINVLIKEFVAHYSALTAGTQSVVPELPIQYIDYALWQREYLQGDVRQKQLDHWSQQLADIPVIHKLPLDYPRPQSLNSHGKRVDSELSAELVVRIERLAAQQSVTPFMVIHAAFSLLLSRYSNDPEVVIGTPIANRTQPELENLIGFFVNTLVLRTRAEPSYTFAQFLAHIKQINLEAQSNQDLPFEHIVEQLNIPRNPQHSPLFQIMLQMNTTEQTELSLPGVNFSPLETGVAMALFELSLDVMIYNKKGILNWTYNIQLFKQQRIEQMNSHLLRILDIITQHPQVQLTQIEILSNQEKDWILNQLNPYQPLTKHEFLPYQMVEYHATLNPSHIAVVDGEQKINYIELHQMSDNLAYYLTQKGCSQGDVIGIGMGSTIQTIVAIIGIMKAGGAYVPIDPNHPQIRKQHMVVDSGIKLLLTTSQWLPRFNGVVLECIELDRINLDPLVAVSDRLPKTVTVNDLAYIIYTSGSTGLPKGIRITQGNLQAYCLAAQSCYQLKDTDRMLQFSSVSFDIFIEELFISLLTGASVVIRNEHLLSGGDEFWQFIRKNLITITSLPTAFWHQICHELPEQQILETGDLRLTIVGGEAMSGQSLIRWKNKVNPSVRLLNTYGPSESTIIATVYDTTHYQDKDLLPAIGKPVPGSYCIIVDHTGNLCPLGVIGELLICGPQVGIGYLNQTELTAHHFVADKWFGTDYKVYKTGDQAYLLADGNIQFVGRMDEQVKIRGFRIELAEVTEHITNLDSIKSAVVITDKVNEYRALVAYIVPQQEVTEDFISEVKAQLRSRCPDYMIPNIFVLMDSIPLTLHGKVDRQSLPSPENNRSAVITYVAPANPIEKEICLVWQELLNIKRVGAIDNFFILGGHSLLATRVVNVLKQRFEVDVSLKALFTTKDVRALADYIGQLQDFRGLSQATDSTNEETASQDHLNQLVELRTSINDELVPLFIVHPVGGSVYCYMDLVRELTPGRAIYGIQSRHESELTITQMANVYLSSIQQKIGDKAFALAGWSVGGGIAYEMACQQGIEKIPEVIVIDSDCPTEDAVASDLSSLLLSFAAELNISSQGISEQQITALLNQELEAQLTFILALGKEQGRLAVDTTLQELHTHFTRLYHNAEAYHHFRPQTYEGVVHYIQAEKTVSMQLPIKWKKVMINMEITTLPGDHHSIVKSPLVSTLANKIEQILQHK